MHSERMKRQLLSFLLGVGVGFGLSSIASLASPSHSPHEPEALVWQQTAGTPIMNDGKTVCARCRRPAAGTHPRAPLA